MRTLLTLLFVPLGFYAGLCLLLFLGQRSQIYFPVPESSASGAVPMRLARNGVDLKIWVVPRPGPRALLYFGGNAEDVAANIVSFAAAFPDHSIYLVNYRGYGGSTGAPSETGLVADAIALHDELQPRHPDLSVMGRSLGSAIAVQLASVRSVSRLVLVTPFDSLVNVARAHFPYLPVGLLLRDRYDSASRVARLKTQTLVVMAGSDEIIPRARTEALIAALPPSLAQVVVLEGARHNDIDLERQYLERVRAFLAS